MVYERHFTNQNKIEDQYKGYSLKLELDLFAQRSVT